MVGETSKLQLLVWRELIKLGYRVFQDMPTEDGMMEVDMQLMVDDVKFALQVDGPYHFLGNYQSKFNKKTLLRNELLQHRGWRVISIPWYEMDRLLEQGEGVQQYLSDKIQAEVQKLRE
eukprot:TRINITY_DN14223_c2_g1_i1.p2 TRINITY_DN14223_c2_g1~~TRINITY_DN14223_c2_g1_i1.p2  ORF type:complete len:134 (-),score=22.70 TRINITY_DN14223_c2_g1_i1:102-458(-)